MRLRDWINSVCSVTPCRKTTLRYFGGLERLPSEAKIVLGHQPQLTYFYGFKPNRGRYSKSDTQT
jgi:hypothetical protein